MKKSLVRYQQCQSMVWLILLEHLMWVEACLLVEQASNCSSSCSHPAVTSYDYYLPHIFSSRSNLSPRFFKGTTIAILRSLLLGAVLACSDSEKMCRLNKPKCVCVGLILRIMSDLEWMLKTILQSQKGRHLFYFCDIFFMSSYFAKFCQEHAQGICSTAAVTYLLKTGSFFVSQRPA